MHSRLSDYISFWWLICPAVSITVHHPCREVPCVFLCMIQEWLLAYLNLVWLWGPEWRHLTEGRPVWVPSPKIPYWMGAERWVSLRTEDPKHPWALMETCALQAAGEAGLQMRRREAHYREEKSQNSANSPVSASSSSLPLSSMNSHPNSLIIKFLSCES